MQWKFKPTFACATTSILGTGIKPGTRRPKSINNFQDYDWDGNAGVKGGDGTYLGSI